MPEDRDAQVIPFPLDQRQQTQEQRRLDSLRSLQDSIDAGLRRHDDHDDERNRR